MTGMLDKNPEDQTYTNALVMIDSNGAIINKYNKHHLVPFGEYIPFQKWIPFKPIAGFSGFVSGPGAQTYKTPENLTFTPLICYEGMFPGILAKPKQHPDFIINVTNDAWYGKSAGPEQHFTQTMFRAIEEGAPLIRSANTGISGLFDPFGRIQYKTGTFQSESITLDLEKRLK